MLARLPASNRISSRHTRLLDPLPASYIGTGRLSLQYRNPMRLEAISLMAVALAIEAPEGRDRPTHFVLLGHQEAVGEGVAVVDEDGVEAGDPGPALDRRHDRLPIAHRGLRDD